MNSIKSTKPGDSTVSGVTTFRLYLLRATYALIVVGLGAMIWPGLLNPPENLSHMGGVVRSLLGAVSLLALVGVRYPLKMLPLLFFELVWKTIWVLAIGFHLWSTHQLNADTGETMRDCLIGVVVFSLVIPWGYVFAHYVRAPADRWGRSREARVHEGSPHTSRGEA